MGKGIFITGTDTGVGKTLITAGLGALLRERGIDVGVMKPAESGCRRQDGALVPQDALFLKAMSSAQDALSLINPYALEQALAPAQAAELERVDIRLAVIRKAYAVLTRRHELVLIEGAGGMMVPLNPRLLMADLPGKLGNTPILVVARDALGAINHTLLTIHYARAKGIAVMGIVLNRTSGGHDPAQCHNSAALQRWAKAPLLGAMPFIPRPDLESIKETAKANLNIEPLMRWLGR